MGVLKIDLSAIQRIRWPDKCAYCGAIADSESRIRLTAFSGLKYYIVAFGWTEHKYTILYPVCKKHNGFVYNRMPSGTFALNLFTCIMIGLALIGLLSALWDIKGDAFNYFILALAIVFLGLVFFSLFISPFVLRPVRIFLSRNKTVKLYIHDEDCFCDFLSINKDIIHEKKGGFQSINVHNSHHAQPILKRDPEIPKELKIFDFIISEYQGRPVLKGKFINQSIYFLKKPFGSFSVGESGKEILFFPYLNIEKANSIEIIEPFEEGEFCHYLSERENASIKELSLESLKLQFLEFDKSQKKD